jgi:hypothetical protein
MMDGLQIPIPRRIMYVRITVVCSLLILMTLSMNLWCGERLFPRSPITGSGQVPRYYEIILVAVFMLLLAGSMFFKFHRLLLFLALAAGATLVLLDLNRMQPWFYIFMLAILVFVFYNGRVDDSNRYTSYFIILQIIFASVYFFCGLNQLNCGFVHGEYSQLISPLRRVFSERQFNFFVRIGAMVPYLFMLIGIALTISVTRYLAITMAVVVHVALFIFLIPPGNRDYAMWMSNLSFILIVVLIFSGKTKQRYFSPTFLLQRPLFYLIFILCVVMPFFNHRNRWPDYMSFNFKSGNNLKADIMLSPDARMMFPVSVSRYLHTSGEYLSLDYNGWCTGELNVSCFPHARVFNSISEELRRKANGRVKEIELGMIPRQPLLCKQ